MGSKLSQLFPPAAKFTEKQLPDQSDKVRSVTAVFLITGASTGLGFELARLLYIKGAKIHIAARSESNGAAAIKRIKSAHPTSKGSLHFHHLDLSDLPSVVSSAKSFLSKESRLDVLWNNAGVMMPPTESKTNQGYELQMGTNCLGPFLFTKLLTPLLVETAMQSGSSTRVVWVSSSAAEIFGPKGGVDLKALQSGQESKSDWRAYGESKAGNVLYAKEFARRFKDNNVISTSLDPGNLKTDLQRHLNGLQALIIRLILHPPIKGAYTELFAGLSPDVTLAKSGVVPWGRFSPLRSDIEQAGLTEEEGGTGNAREFWEWSEKQVEQYL
ncbi:uncharacterized protein KY384_006984 [Bacidia gigantensis]|uniref:uncharacterized protein n=1 Tax=Bacidia gigantensis TaxID=2732470 RepID=UPI001D03F3F4|nr:uncharacterized protein KY384_006984 [Bacidia gigantensis]KAG8528068.1 hypothetical protein KY384_006984 [Bacidia gigantensis]